MSQSIDDFWDALWAPGFHSLCAQSAETPFTVIGHYDNPAALMTAARRLPEGSNVWWGVNGMAVPPARGRGGVEHVTAVTCLYGDYDWADEIAHKGADLPTQAELVAILEVLEPTPTAWVNSGHGVQLYWGLADVLDRETAQNLSDGFHRYLEQRYGLRNDRRDLASVLRVPGTTNWKSDPIPVESPNVDLTMGWQSEHLFDNRWLPAPPILIRGDSTISEESGRLPPRLPAVSSVVNGDDEISPLDWMNESYDPFPELLRQGWTEGPRRGVEQQMVRPGKDRRGGTSATYHHDSKILNIFSTSVDALYHHVGIPRNGCITLKPVDVWMVANGISDPVTAASVLRTNVMPRRVAVAPPPPLDDPAPPDERLGLNLGDEFWVARPVLEHIRTAAWSMSCSPDAVFAALLARYSANVHPSIMLPEWGTLDFFAVIAGHSGGFKSKAGKTAARLWPGWDDAAVMMDHNVGSGEAIAEAFFEWRDEDGQPCGASKKGAQKVRTRWGLHFATDETTALTKVAARSGAIIVPTLCQAWMGEAIGQILADPSRSRMIAPHQVRISAELKIQTAHGFMLFADDYASTGLAQRMVCFSSLDPTFYERRMTGMVQPEWPGELHLERPFILTGQPREMLLSPAIAEHLAAVALEAHNPAWSGDPLDTHADLARLKIAALLALIDTRFDVSDDDWVLAGMVLDVHRRVRALLQATKRNSDRQRIEAAQAAEIERTVRVDEERHRALLRRAVAAIQARIEADKPIGKKHVSKEQREVYEEAMVMLEAQGFVREVEGGWSAAT